MNARVLNPSEGEATPPERAGHFRMRQPARPWIHGLLKRSPRLGEWGRTSGLDIVVVVDHAEAAVRPLAAGCDRGAQDPQAGWGAARSRASASSGADHRVVLGRMAELARCLRWADGHDRTSRWVGTCSRPRDAPWRGAGPALVGRRPGRRADRGEAQRRGGGCEGCREELLDGPTKTGQARVVDLDAGTVAGLRAYRTARRRLALDVVRDTAVVLSSLDGTHRHPERARKTLGRISCR